MPSPGDRSQGAIFRRQTLESDERPQDFQINAEEFMSQGLEIMVATKCTGLESRVSLD